MNEVGAIAVGILIGVLIVVSIIYGILLWKYTQIEKKLRNDDE